MYVAPGDGAPIAAVGGSSEVTVRTACALVAFPKEFETRQRNWSPSPPGPTDAIMYEGDVAPPMSTLFLCHWYVSVGAPAAATVNVTGYPSEISWLSGSCVIVGALLPV